MPSIDLKFMCHILATFLKVQLIAQKRRKMSLNRAFEVQKQVQALLDVAFIREVIYLTWLSNIIMVKNSERKWRMCVDYTDLNKACPKDSYPPPSIDGLVDAGFNFKFSSFMDVYSGYN